MKSCVIIDQYNKVSQITHWYGFGLGISLLWFSHTGAGSLNGGWGTGWTVGIGGTIGPLLVFQSTRIAVVSDASETRKHPMFNFCGKI